MAALHEDTATACSDPTEAENSFSNAATSGPVVTQPDSSTRATASRASGAMYVRANGIRSRQPLFPTSISSPARAPGADEVLPVRAPKCCLFALRVHAWIGVAHVPNRA